MSKKNVMLAVAFRDGFRDMIDYTFYTLDLADMVTLVDWKGTSKELKAKLLLISDNVWHRTQNASWDNNPNLKAFSSFILEDEAEAEGRVPDFLFIADGSMRAPIKYKSVEGAIITPYKLEVVKNKHPLTYIITRYRPQYIKNPKQAESSESEFYRVLGTTNLGEVQDTTSLVVNNTQSEIEMLRYKIWSEEGFIIPSSDHPYGGFAKYL